MSKWKLTWSSKICCCCWTNCCCCFSINSWRSFCIIAFFSVLCSNCNGKKKHSLVSNIFFSTCTTNNKMRNHTSVLKRRYKDNEFMNIMIVKMTLFYCEISRLFITECSFINSVFTLTKLSFHADVLRFWKLCLILSNFKKSTNFIISLLLKEILFGNDFWKCNE